LKKKIVKVKKLFEDKQYDAIDLTKEIDKENLNAKKEEELIEVSEKINSKISEIEAAEAEKIKAASKGKKQKLLKLMRIKNKE
jgi:hypothetical protein